MNQQTIEQYGDELYQAFVSRRVIAPLLSREPQIRIEDAYRIQERFIARRLAAGETIVGKKIGATSKPVQDFLGVYQPDFGMLTSGMVFADGDTPRPGPDDPAQGRGGTGLCPQARPQGPGITAMDVIRATDYVVPCFEVVDSRIRDWQIKIQDTVADNASCGVFVLGHDPGRSALAGYHPGRHGAGKERRSVLHRRRRRRARLARQCPWPGWPIRWVSWAFRSKRGR
jgi:2-oxopent-4-enoate/cis-2-oxohex-4-enoate hydratase